MAKRIVAKDVNVYYGKFQAVDTINMTIAPNSVTAFIGPSGCGKTTFLRSLNRMIETIPGGRVTGEIKMNDLDINAPTSTRSACVATWAWCSSAPTRSRPCPSTRTWWPA